MLREEKDSYQGSAFRRAGPSLKLGTGFSRCARCAASREGRITRDARVPAAEDQCVTNTEAISLIPDPNSQTEFSLRL